MNLKEFIAMIKGAAQQGGSSVQERARWQPKWIIKKYADDTAFISGMPTEVLELPGNLLLNEGITEFLTLLIGGSATAYNNANARIGVGDSSTAESAAQTDLQAAVNKLYKAMDATYPQVSGQTVTFRATFGATDANFAWNEITVDNGAVAGKNLNRKVQGMGTKANPAIWVVSLQVTIS